MATRIKWLTNCDGPTGHVYAGHEETLSNDAEAARLIAAGYALAAPAVDPAEPLAEEAEEDTAGFDPGA